MTTPEKILIKKYEEIRVDTRIKTDDNIQNNRLDIYILDKRKYKIILIEVGITFQDIFKWNYDLLANELGLIYRFCVDIIPYVMIWEGLRENNTKSCLKRLQIPINLET
ncbi:hypothetical protein CWI39_0520p0020 [Hamiltosporidium magnivora]|uniref:Uncharacterized protein n=1 Tax=Hamiltosporidium magnivora TaxID=148818 RepID=A0A4Q9LE78_9MICR|nr:hypothetical protein CWI39_0520p0020 [Hamiltosporidium magnivora]